MSVWYCSAKFQAGSYSTVRNGRLTTRLTDRGILDGHATAEPGPSPSAGRSLTIPGAGRARPAMSMERAVLEAS